MTPTEAGPLVAAMQASWPGFARDDVGVRLWLEDLGGLDYELAEKTFRKLRNTEERPPTWALFQGAYWALAPAPPYVPPAPDHGSINVGGPYVDRKAAVKLLQQTRTKLALAESPSALRKEWTPLRGTGAVDPLEPALTYAEVYGDNGEPRPEYRAEIEAMKRRP